jgi:preprotein translocase subunit SecE
MQSVLGIVAISFILAALLVSYVVAHGLHWAFLSLGVIDRPLLGDRFTTTTAIAAALAFGLAFALWRSPRVNGLAQEVVSELKKVTWPSMAETKAATVVVIITSILVSLLLGVFDLGFNWLIERIF